MLEQTGLQQHCSEIIATPADWETLSLAHPIDHIKRLTSFIEQGNSSIDGDTSVCKASVLAAQMAAGAPISGLNLMQEAKTTRVFCSVRPPGHHAETAKAMGFCLFNNVAVAARYAQSIGLANKILIVDWDVHHGNGTQQIFESDPTVFFYSLHQYPCYPGTGSALETGLGKGKGFTFNRPLDPQTGDDVYFRYLDQDLNRICKSFTPDLIIVSAGFDAHDQDPLAGMRVTSKGFGTMTRMVCDLADHYCGGRLLSVLEGGYHLDALAESVRFHLETMYE